MTAPQSIACPICGATSHHPDDVANGYCARCCEFTSDAPVALARQAFVALQPIMADLTLPQILPDEPVPAGAREMTFEGEGISLRRGSTVFYRENGEPIDLPATKAIDVIEGQRAVQGREIRMRLRTMQGTAVEVATTYLGVDLSIGGPLPLIWETLVIIGDDASFPFLLEPYRYATMAAAHAGHDRVVEALRDALGRAWPSRRDTRR